MSVLAAACVGSVLAAAPALGHAAGDTPGYAVIAPEYEPALLVAVRVALNNPGLTSWSSDTGRAGYVTVSAARWQGRRECRLYRYTVADDGGDGLSPDIMACRRDPSAGWDLHSGTGW